MRFGMRARLELTRWCAVALAVAFGAQVSAQDVRIAGIVRDSSEAAVNGVKVELHSQSYSATTFTWAAGDFAFERVAGRSGSLVVSAPGLHENRHNWNASDGNLTQLEIILSPSGVTQQVTVTARASTPLEDSPTSDRQLTSKDLVATPNLALDDTLRQIPGFSLFRRSSSRTANPTTQGVSLRGVGANGASRVLVLEDGIPWNDFFGAWMYWDRIPNQAVESIEVSQLMGSPQG